MKLDVIKKCDGGDWRKGFMIVLCFKNSIPVVSVRRLLKVFEGMVYSGDGDTILYGPISSFLPRGGFDHRLSFPVPLHKKPCWKTEMISASKDKRSYA